MKHKRFAVFGNPIIHSFSPYIFEHLFKKNNVKWKYNRIFATNPNNIIKFINEFNLSGCNITAPLKQSVIPYLSSITEDSKLIDAVNTIIKYNEKLLGFNTDWEGVLNSLRNFFINKKINFDLNNKQILVIGAGNSATAAIYGINKFFPQSKIDIINRNIDKAQKLAEKFNSNFINKSKATSKLLEQYDIIIITIPNPKDYFSKIKIPTKSILFFANYTELEYFNKLKTTNKNLILGDKWLKEQAISAFEYYYGYDEYCKKIQLTSNKIKKEYKNLKDKNIYITGFSGAGKTFLGEKIAKSLNREFIDLDKLFEETLGESIENIFKKYGESIFRKYESELLSVFQYTNNYVVTLGGGTIIEPKNQKTTKKGFVIYLYSDLETSLSRINIASYPMLANRTKNEIEELFQTRKFIYFDNSDIIIENDGKSDNKIIKEISNLFKKYE